MFVTSHSDPVGLVQVLRQLSEYRCSSDALCMSNIEVPSVIF